MGVTFESDSVKKRFDELNKLHEPGPLIQETADDIQAAKLITAVDFVKHRSQQLAEQLTSLRSWLEMS